VCIDFSARGNFENNVSVESRGKTSMQRMKYEKCGEKIR
jgi:hypothetical protein